jgi:phenylalanyl-tRNA synthetase alpha chain
MQGTRQGHHAKVEHSEDCWHASIHSTLTPSQLARDLAVRDLTDPTEGGHAIQLLIDAAIAPSPRAGTARCDGTASRMLRSHSTAMVPSALRTLAAELADDTLVVCPGVVYRRDAIDRLHAATPHQLDLWRITRRSLNHADLCDMVRLLVQALAPGRPYRWEPRVHPYTPDGRQVDVCWDGDVSRCSSLRRWTWRAGRPTSSTSATILKGHR